MMSSRYEIQTNSNVSKPHANTRSFSSIACNGVYILLGNDPEAIENTWCYIGKTENFVERLRNHDKKKPQWEKVGLISNSTDNSADIALASGLGTA